MVKEGCNLSFMFLKWYYKLGFNKTIWFKYFQEEIFAVMEKMWLCVWKKVAFLGTVDFLRELRVWVSSLYQCDGGRDMSTHAMHAHGRWNMKKTQKDWSLLTSAAKLYVLNTAKGGDGSHQGERYEIWFSLSLSLFLTLILRPVSQSSWFNFTHWHLPLS